MTDIRDLARLPEVERWLAGAGYDARPAEEREVLLADLAEFCAFTGQGPAELVASCMRTTKEGLTKISIKGRRAMQQSIGEYVAYRGLSGREAIVVGNRIRGFLVHNGVFIQGPASIR